jgi:MoxR-like ATPase
LESAESTAGFANQLPTDNAYQTLERIKAEVRKVIVGQEELIDLMLAALLANGHVLIEGVPGVAKTLAVKALTRAVGARFSRIQFTPDLMPSDVLGTSVFNVKSGEFEFKSGPIFAQMILIDEVNRSPAKTQSALFEVMEERQITMDGTTYPMQPPFLVFATQNPIEQEGTYRLPEAQLDRFLFHIEINYPLPEQELTILHHHDKATLSDRLATVQVVATDAQLVAFQDLVRKIRIEENLLKYIVSIVHLTRNHPSLYLGASPRASIALMNASKAIALMAGRDFVTPEDIRYVTLPIMRHRIQLTPEKEMQGFTPRAVIQQVLEQVEVPR